MGRKLKTYITSEGFFDKAIAAPSMKAALDEWGASHNLFQQGFAKESDDPAIIAATMQYPGVVLKRPVGSDGPFKKHAELPRSILSHGEESDAAVTKKMPKERGLRAKPRLTPRDRDAAKAFEREKLRREKQRQKEDALRKAMAKRREAAVAKARVALQAAEKKHEKILAACEARQRAIATEIAEEDVRWETERKRLKAAMHKAEEQ